MPTALPGEGGNVHKCMCARFIVQLLRMKWLCHCEVPQPSSTAHSIKRRMSRIAPAATRFFSLEGDATVSFTDTFNVCRAVVILVTPPEVR